MEKNNRLVLGLAGYARTGKDMVGGTIAKMCAKDTVKILKLASSLRRILTEEKSLPRGVDIYSEDPVMKIKARPFLVAKAQELRKGDPDFFVKELIKEIDTTPPDCLCIITDVRYENEVDYLSNYYNNFEFIVINRHGAKPGSEEERTYTTPLYDGITQYRNGTYLFVPELAKYVESDQELLSNNIVSSVLISEVLTFGLPDFSRNKLFITEKMTKKGIDSVETIEALGLNLKYLEENYL